MTPPFAQGRLMKPNDALPSFTGVYLFLSTQVTNGNFVNNHGLYVPKYAAGTSPTMTVSLARTFVVTVTVSVFP